MTRKKILIISPFPPQIGGVSISSERLLQNLIADGFDVDYYRIKFKNNRYNKKILLTFKFFFIPFYILFNKKFDIIHLHVPATYRKVYISLTKKLFFKGAKTIFTLHGDVGNLLNSKLALWALSKADKIICVQKGDSQRLPIQLQQKSIDIPAFILPLNIDEKEVPNEVLNFCKINNKPLIVFYGAVKLSGLFDLYGISDIFKLYNNLQEHNCYAKLLLLITVNKKDKSQVTFLQNQIDTIKNNYDIMIIQSPNFSLMPILKYTNIYIRPTKTDGDSLAVREAMAMGCTVIASNNAKRPNGVVTYSEDTELFPLVKTYLNITHKKSSVQENYYQKILNVYEDI